eukprot:CAMPEP_0116153990 /NCGR_PEP_ID=MMETSP0329-20121206/21542_1 /TAXON_ID=697910 /ORGANISM="Pseudo-nitzschia arenysensis, Strain B593" /LENGTH=510 /DNA_ID=CAMNT_0003650941 /DNA_START=179 /DNA_END=1711 /DNA_ORIENTATION=+
MKEMRKWLLYCLMQMGILESVTPSFISWSHPASDKSHQTKLQFNFHVPLTDAEFRASHLRPPTLVARLLQTKSRMKTAICAADPSASNSNINEPFEIPIIGPLLTIPKPIIVGESIRLDPPTPLQWKAVEASVTAQHGGTIMNWKSNTASEIDEMLPDKINLATIEKSPLVAILHNGENEYATIAAIEGIVTNKDGSIDTSDAESFRESLASLYSPYYSDSSKIRLMAIGRAKVSHFVTKFLMDDSFANNLDYNEMGDGVNSASEPLLVARMELLYDSNNNGEKSSSPVHALNRLSAFAQRVRLLQEDRQRIVRGLQAAQIRLEMAMNDWEDWDGIGLLNTDIEPSSTAEEMKSKVLGDDSQTTALNQFLEDYASHDIESLTPSHSLPLSTGSARCIDLDNYGLGTSSSVFVPLSSMTNALTENLRNYYSPMRLESEEFEYEIFSWCALRSLQSYLSSEEIHEALFSCTNTCERLEIIYRGMIKHKMELNELAQAKSLELRNCGEECDLF